MGKPGAVPIVVKDRIPSRLREAALVDGANAVQIIDTKLVRTYADDRA